jgi:hypothetical protein
MAGSEIDCTKFGFKEWDSMEITRGVDPVTIKNYPKPGLKMRLVYQSFNQSIEEVYFFLLQNLKEDLGLHNVTKVTDIFTASEQSAFWGQAQQRLSIQQGQVSNYLATVGKLTKELFQIVRELTILDERMALYNEINRAIESKPSVFERKKSYAAEVVLRGYWVDLKDGGVKSPGSVYGLAGTLGYVALPDLFFAAPPLTGDEVDNYVDVGCKGFNDRLKDVLKKKLKAYVLWRDYTFKEVKNRRNFTVKFLRQHYNAIQMYINWIKPYLKNVKRLSQNMNRLGTEDLIGAFEGSFTEVELICSRKIDKYWHAAVVLNINFRTSPHMDFHQEGYQHKGPVHVGRSEFILRGYAWTDEDFKNYLAMREKETMEIIGDVDESLKESIDALGDDLRKYLKEAGEKFPEDIKKEEDEKKEDEKKRLEQMKGALEPVLALFGGFKEIFTALIPIRSGGKKDVPDWQKEEGKGKAMGAAKSVIWGTYKNFKKGHRMVTW